MKNCSKNIRSIIYSLFDNTDTFFSYLFKCNKSNRAMQLFELKYNLNTISSEYLVILETIREQLV